jgi:DNA-binding response OmpR family regulator
MAEINSLVKDITVLLVDDDPLIHKIVEASLMKDNFRVLYASNGEAGLAMAQQNKPDVVLLDVVMPGMDGFEVCQKLRQDPYLQYVPIIILTALDDRDSKVQGLEAGADDYICKPFDKLEFRARVRTVTRLNRLGSCQDELDYLQKLIHQKDDEIRILKVELEKLKNN